MQITENRIYDITELLYNSITVKEIQLAKRFARLTGIDYNMLVGMN